MLQIHEQDAESYWGEVVKKPEYAKQLEEAGPAHTALLGDTVLACIGVIPEGDHCARAWAIMAREIGAHYITIHRAVLRFMKLMDYPRIQTTVDCKFEDGIRWAEMLGFVNETPFGMRKYAPDGRDHFLYARVQA